MTKARVSYTGLVEWQPPAVYKSSCAIDVEYFPYDVQTCVLKLGSWTYDGFKVICRFPFPFHISVFTQKCVFDGFVLFFSEFIIFC